MNTASEPETRAASIEKVRASEFDPIEVTRIVYAMKLEGVENGREKNCGDVSLKSDTCNLPDGCDDSSAELTGGMVACPATPSPERGSLELSPSSDLSEQHDALSGSRTPTANIFDPFAAGPEELIFAPKKKTLRATQIQLRRQLNFDDLDDSAQDKAHFVTADAAEEGHLLEYFSQSFLELIVSSHAQEISAGTLPDHDSHSECPKTPISVPFLTGIAETCFLAPRRPLAKPRRLDPGVCRKLVFGTN